MKASVAEFAGKVAVVTGSSGIGLGAALRLARGGAQVFLCGNDAGHNARAAEAAHGLAVTVTSADLAEPAAVAGFIDQAARDGGGIDIIVNAAGIQTYGSAADTDLEHWERVMAVNLRACYLTVHHAYPHLKAGGGGAVVHVASVQGHANQRRVLAYATAKGGLHALTRAMAVDCAADNIRVNSVSPGSVRTPMLEFAAAKLGADGQDIEDTLAGFGAAHPVGRIGTVAEVAELIAFLASDRAAFCTGGDYLVDGGLTAQLGVN